MTRPITLVAKVLLPVGLLYLLTFVSLLVYQHNTRSENAMASFNHELELYAKLLLPAAQDALIVGDVSALQNAKQALLTGNNIVGIRVMDLDNNSLYTAPEKIDHEAPAKAFDIVTQDSAFNHNGSALDNTLQADNQKIGTLVIHFDRQLLNSQISTIFNDLWLFMSIGVVSMLALLFYLRTLIVKPIVAFLSLLKTIGTDKYCRNEKYVHRHDEIGSIYKLIDLSNQRIISAQEEQQSLNKKIIDTNLSAQRDNFERIDNINQIIKNMILQLHEGIDSLAQVDHKNSNKDNSWHYRLVEQMLNDVLNQLRLAQSTAQKPGFLFDNDPKCVNLKLFFQRWSEHIHSRPLERDSKKIHFYSDFNEDISTCYGLIDEGALEFCFWCIMDIYLKHSDCDSPSLSVSCNLIRTSDQTATVSATITGKVNFEHVALLQSIGDYLSGFGPQEAIQSEVNQIMILAIRNHLRRRNGSLQLNIDGECRVTISLAVNIPCFKNESLAMEAMAKTKEREFKHIVFLLPKTTEIDLKNYSGKKSAISFNHQDVPTSELTSPNTIIVLDIRGTNESDLQWLELQLNRCQNPVVLVGRMPTHIGIQCLTQFEEIPSLSELVKLHKNDFEKKSPNKNTNNIVPLHR